jgi:hypothetical protein
VSPAHLAKSQCSCPTAFGSSLSKRFDNKHDTSLISDLQTQIRGLPLLPSSTLTAKQEELDTLGTKLWNLSTRLRRGEPFTEDSRPLSPAHFLIPVTCFVRGAGERPSVEELHTTYEGCTESRTSMHGK